MSKLRVFTRDLAAYLQRNGVTDAEISVRRITEHVLGVKSASFPQSISPSLANTVRQLSERRLFHEPLQYILGEWDFYNLKGIKCAPPCLIPRPETEELVDLVVNAMRSTETVQTTNRFFLEVGVGTGAISIALLKYLQEHPTMQPWKGIGIDLNKAAVDLSNQNATKFGVFEDFDVARVAIADICDASNRSALDTATLDGKFVGFDMMVSNPPYIPSRHVSASAMQPEVYDWEDHRALDGGCDGLDVIRDIFSAACGVIHSCSDAEPTSLLKKDADIWLETDESHANDIEKMVGALVVIL